MLKREMIETRMRSLTSSELDLAAGGTDDIIVVTAERPSSFAMDWFLERAMSGASFTTLASGIGGAFGGGGGGGPAGEPGEFVDTDGDGEEDTIVVTATAWQMEVLDAWQTWANLNYSLADLALNFVPMTRIAELTLQAVLSANQENTVDQIAAAYYTMDSWDNLVDGYVQPQYLPPNTVQLPQMQPGYWIGSAR